MVRPTINVRKTLQYIFDAMWIALLSTGCAGGAVFLVVASGIVYAEDWCAQRGLKIHG